ncbi:unnamed protein product, partial [Phaeothamnion confervicola]
MPRYYCDYCSTYLTHDSAPGRRQHIRGWKHRENVRAYYQSYMTEYYAKKAGKSASESEQAGGGLGPPMRPGPHMLDRPGGNTLGANSLAGPPPGGAGMAGGNSLGRNALMQGGPPGGLPPGGYGAPPHHPGGPGGYMPRPMGGMMQQGPPPQHPQPGGPPRGPPPQQGPGVPPPGWGGPGGPP